MRNAPLFLIPLLSLLTTITPNPIPHDACGPLIQDPDTPDTCNQAVRYVKTPNQYGAVLTNDGSGFDVAWDNCYPVVYDVCTMIADPDQPTGAWNWTGAGSGCSMGFWLSEYQGAAPLPTSKACYNNIYMAMVNIGKKMGGTAYNQVTVNLATLPDNTRNGSQINVGYPSYTISYLPMQSAPVLYRSKGKQ